MPPLSDTLYSMPFSSSIFIVVLGLPIIFIKSEFRKYPKYYENYIRAFDKLVKRLNERNGCSWQSGEEVMKWWVSDDKEIEGQFTFDGFDTLDV